MFASFSSISLGKSMNSIEGKNHVKKSSHVFMKHLMRDFRSRFFCFFTTRGPAAAKAYLEDLIDIAWQTLLGTKH